MRHRSLTSRLLAATLVLVGGLSLLVAQATAHRGDRDDRRGERPRPHRVTDYIVPGATAFPEGIAVERRGRVHHFFVSSVGTGAIFRGRPGKAELREFLPAGGDGRTSTVGLGVDQRRGRLIVAGGASGTIWVYSIRSKRLLAKFETGPGGFINDVAVSRRGDVYLTDSIRPVLWKITEDQIDDADGATIVIPPFITFGPEAEYGPGFNANGIVLARNKRVLLIVNSRVGKLLRVHLPSRTTTQVDLGGATVVNGDGLVLLGRKLLVIRNRDAKIDVVKLRKNLRKGRVVGSITDPRFRFPTTGAVLGRKLLVVNGQLDQQGGSPVLPFTVSVLGSHDRGHHRGRK